MVCTSTLILSVHHIRHKSHEVRLDFTIEELAVCVCVCVCVSEFLSETSWPVVQTLVHVIMIQVISV